MSKVLAFLIEHRKKAEEEAQEKAFWQLAGAWESEETGTELAQQLYEDRNDYSREIEL